MSVAATYAPNRYHRVQMNTVSLNNAHTKALVGASLKGYSLHCIIFRTATDPCMGSGHILVYAFDVLIDIYTACGWSERDAAKSILRNNLYGLDIDRRAYQLAYFAVMMKARQYNRRILSAENQPNLANFADVMHVDTSLLSGSLRKFAEQFQFADTYGSLMTVTMPAGLDEAVSAFLPTFGMQAEQLEMMMRVAQILMQKYDVVCTNPPYMGGSGMNATLSDYVKKNFPDSKSDLSTCFMEQCGRLATKNGYYAMINIPVWMFLSSYEKLRKKIEIGNTYVNMVHFGRGIFGADFGTTSFVISKKHINEYIGVYRRLFEKQGAVDSVEQKQKWFFEGMGYYTAKQENFSKIPGSPVAYWVSEKIFDCFANFEKIDDVANPRQGLATGNNEKFLRLWYEVSNKDIKFDAVSLDDFFETNRKYIPYNKGGSFRKWFANMEFIIRFDRKHYGILGTVGNHLPSKDFYFKESITWSKVTSGGLSMRYIPHGSAFDVAGCSIFCDRNIMYILGFVNSCVMQNLMNVLSQTLNYEVGSVKQIPIIYKDVEKIESIVKENVSISKEDLVSYESHFEFEKHPLV